MGNLKYNLFLLIAVSFLLACGRMEGQTDVGEYGVPSSRTGFKAEDFYDTGQGNSLVQNDALFDFVEIDNSKAIHTSSEQTNIHTHFLKDFPLSDFVYSGKMQVSDANAGIGITFLSQYPQQDVYYRLRRYSGEPSFHIANHGGRSACEGESLNQNIVANTWYNFRVKVSNLASSTQFEVSVWQEGTDSNQASTLQCEDSSGQRLTSGTIGMWAMGPGDKYWADLRLDIDLIGFPVAGVEGVEAPAEEPVAEEVETPVTDEVTMPTNSNPLPAGEYPNANNTGSRIARANLTSSSMKIISQPGVYEGLYLQGKIEIQADNVTLRDCIVRGPVYITGANARLEYVEIDGYNGATGFTGGIGLVSEFSRSAPYIYRIYIHHFFDLFRPGAKGIEVQESYLYNWGAPNDGNHADAVQFPVWHSQLKAPYKIIFNRNTVYEPSNNEHTAAMGFNSLTSEWIVTNNYFRGSGFMLYIAEGGYTLSNNNFAGEFRWGTYRLFNNGGDYGEWNNNRGPNGSVLQPPK